LTFRWIRGLGTSVLPEEVVASVPKWTLGTAGAVIVM
jgi:hypothetical protein